MTPFQKLKHEWKTFALGVVTTAIGIWDTVASSGYDISPIIPEKYRPYAIPVIGIAFLLLRKYIDKKEVNVADHQ